jgi:hypothetical protein
LHEPERTHLYSLPTILLLMANYTFFNHHSLSLLNTAHIE